MVYEEQHIKKAVEAARQYVLSVPIVSSAGNDGVMDYLRNLEPHLFYELVVQHARRAETEKAKPHVHLFVNDVCACGERDN